MDAKHLAQWGPACFQHLSIPWVQAIEIIAETGVWVLICLPIRRSPFFSFSVHCVLAMPTLQPYLNQLSVRSNQRVGRRRWTKQLRQTEAKMEGGGHVIRKETSPFTLSLSTSFKEVQHTLQTCSRWD